MFDSIKAMGAIAGILKNKQGIADAGARVQDKLENRRIVVDTPDKSISVVMNGKLALQEVRLDPAVIQAAATDPAGKERLEKLVVGAVNAALVRTKDIIQEEIAAEAKAMGLGDVGGLGGLLK